VVELFLVHVGDGTMFFAGDAFLDIGGTIFFYGGPVGTCSEYSCSHGSRA